MDLKEKITELALSKLTNPAHFLVDVVVSKHKPMKITMIVDGDPGITIDDCANLSREVNDVLAEWIEEQYSLEVTTPGLDHPLKLKRQFQKNVGRGLKVHLTDKTIVHGVLQKMDEEKIVLEVNAQGKKGEKKVSEIPFEEIEKTFVTVSFK